MAEKITSDTVHQTIERYLSAIPESVEKVELAFFGGSFTAIPEDDQVEFFSAVNPYIKKGVIDTLRISTRPDYIDNNKLDLLKKYNVETVELGVQSFSDEVLEASGRGHNSSQVFTAVSLLKEYGFRVGIQLMPGLPCDSYERSIESAVKTVKLLPDDVRIYPALVLKDTAMEKMFFESKFTPLTIEDAVELCSVMYGMFTEKKINVIRMGLHPMDLSGGNVVAGPYHDALGFMIKSRYRRKNLENLILKEITQNPGKKILSIMIPYEMKEEYIGMKKENIVYLKNRFMLSKLDYTFGNCDNPVIL